MGGFSAADELLHACPWFKNDCLWLCPLTGYLVSLQSSMSTPSVCLQIIGESYENPDSSSLGTGGMHNSEFLVNDSSIACSRATLW